MSLCTGMHDNDTVCMSCVMLSVYKFIVRSNFAVQPHPIQFNEEPDDWTVSVGSSVSLTCNTSVIQIVGYIDEDRTPSPQVEWIHNNVTISSGGHYTINNSTMGISILTITNVTLVEQGDYHCLVNDWKKQDGGWWTSTRSRTGHVTGKYVTTIFINIKSIPVYSVGWQ